jgi:hypothetical protein
MIVKCAACKVPMFQSVRLNLAEQPLRNPGAKVICATCGNKRARFLYFQHKKRMLKK